MISHSFFSTFISLVIYHLTTPLILPFQQSSTALKHQDHKVGEISDLLDLIKIEFDRQNHRITLLEVKNKNQDEDINLLKIDNSQIHGRIDSMDDKVIRHNNDAGPSHSNNADDSTDHANVIPFTQNLKRKNQKRAARLLPLQLLYNGKEVENVPTVPFNCSDLNKMGHTVNGIYLVKGSSNDNSVVKVVLCDFQPLVAQKSFPQSSVTEERLGFVNLDLKSSAGIFFYVQRGNDGPIAQDGVLRFPKEQMNIGKAMNILTGVFTAPKAGIYSFSFSIAEEIFSMMGPLYIYLRVNGIKKGVFKCKRWSDISQCCHVYCAETEERRPNRFVERQG